jgi:PTH1 family peptidyl-tRNA hydrolase
MQLLVGLGNPGRAYASNRHNIGFMALDEIVARYGLSRPKARFAGTVCEGTIDGVRVVALKPSTYMNESGRSVGEAVRFLKIDVGDITVIHDELDLAPGKVRVKRGGGAGGHNGIRSIDAHIGRDYRRVRIGIGHPGIKERVTGHVLDDFSKAEREGWVRSTVEAVAEAVPMLLAGDDAAFMSRVALLTQPPKPVKAKPAQES